MYSGLSDLAVFQSWYYTSAAVIDTVGNIVFVFETDKEQTWQGSLLSRVIFAFLSLQSAGETEASIVAQNKACYESGIVCMKMLVIHVGLTKIYFTDNSGNPVRTH